MSESPRIFGVTGWKNSGKTRMTAALVTELTQRGWKVSTIKHAHHEFDIDKEGTDSWQHRKAGAGEVAIVSGRRWAIMHENDSPDDEPTLEDVVERLSPCDIVLVEGYKRRSHSKIEMRRRETASKAKLSDNDPHIVAIASDEPQAVDDALPVFAQDDIAAIADFIERHTGLAKESAA